MTIQLINRPGKIFSAASLDEAYKLKYFGNSITRDELMERIIKYNDDARWYASRTHRGLWIRGEFVCGIGHQYVIPQFTIVRHDRALDRKLNYSNEYGDRTRTEIINRDEMKGYVLARGWPTIVELVQNKGYRVNTKNLL